MGVHLAGGRDRWYSSLCLNKPAGWNLKEKNSCFVDMNSKKFLISGGTGFVGQYLTRALLRDGHYVTIITRSPEKYSEKQAKNRRSEERRVGKGSKSERAAEFRQTEE